jgi:hypothetical protein
MNDSVKIGDYVLFTNANGKSRFGNHHCLVNGKEYLVVDLSKKFLDGRIKIKIREDGPSWWIHGSEYTPIINIEDDESIWE